LITVRPAAAADQSLIGVLAEAGSLFPARAVADMIAPFLAGNDGEHWLVAQDAAGVCGFCYCALERFTEGTYNLLAIAIAPARRGEGIGGAPLHGLREALRAAGGRLLLVETSSRPEYSAAKAFYRAAGFTPVATIPDFWSAGDDKLVFARPLAR
jgi:ribosomal protein S18 acetylase RimI-like enzyme